MTLKSRSRHAGQHATMATALCAASIFAPVAAHAASPVDPPHHFLFVVDNGVCDFPVQWEGTTRDHGIETPPRFITTSPGWTLTLTNLDTGAVWSPTGDGTISYQDLPDGSTIETLNGVNYAVGLEEQLMGHWTRTLSEDGPSEFVGSGRIINICDQLA